MSDEIGTFAEDLMRVIGGLDRFAADMKQQGIHVGIGASDGVRCAACEEPWPCSTERGGSS